MPTSNPPTPRRCRRILHAHHLDCEGLTPQQIAQQLRCARSTVYAYFRDFQLHRAHILQSVAADRLADQVHILTTPETEADQHRQTVAATRELRLLLQSLPAIQAHEQQQREQALAARTAAAEARAHAHEFETRDGDDGHRRYLRGQGQGDCTLDCPRCLLDFRSRQSGYPDEPAPSEPEPEPSSPKPDQSGPIQTNLDKPGHQIDEYPVPDRVSAQPTPKFTPQTPLRPTKRIPYDDPDTLKTIDIITIDTQFLGRP